MSWKKKKFKFPTQKFFIAKKVNFWVPELARVNKNISVLLAKNMGTPASRTKALGSLIEI